MMLIMEINVEIDETFAGCIDSKWLKDIIREVLKAQDAGNDAEVGLIITGQERIHELNKAYMDEDRPTDVLSFPLIEPSAKTEFVAAPDGKKHLGEIIISFPQSVLQAEEHGHTVEREITVLVIHGILHLLGYDHARRAEKAEMQAREKVLLGLVEKAAG